MKKYFSILSKILHITFIFLDPGLFFFLSLFLLFFDKKQIEGHGHMDEDLLAAKKKKEKEEAANSDGTQVIVKKEKDYEPRKPYLFTLYVLFHLSIQGLIVGTESYSDSTGISQVRTTIYYLIYIQVRSVKLKF